MKGLKNTRKVILNGPLNNPTFPVRFMKFEKVFMGWDLTAEFIVHHETLKRIEKMQTKSLQLVVLAIANYATFENTEVKEATEKLLSALDLDLQNTGFIPSDETEVEEAEFESLMNDIEAIKDGDVPVVVDEDEDDEFIEDDEDEDEDEFGEEFGTEEDDEELDTETE